MDKKAIVKELEFKLQLSEIMSDFYEKMVDMHDEIIADFERIEKNKN